MNERSISVFDTTLHIIVGITVISFVIASVRVIQEYIAPSYSGFGPWRPMVLLPVNIVASGVIAGIIQLIASLAHWGKINKRKYLIIFGGICGAASISSLFTHTANTYFEHSIM